ncbi:PREDICTED: uncharacterized protein LOC109588570 [Amphimedon queenslandica]|uniref:Ig-like domain-containing protein n=1 Tax=Amphimedon queenslandica TaxID=400682 RepID=A0A1X7TDA9_AMPQE|nr:PREDICTED: uncharacterized protein LOC109588570 [Amphimedon queenslandica]|eukprot:XP_019860276.1 PREDICTED: uncharacterized protein LOC109588570 [Amphimedon queenslandica]
MELSFYSPASMERRQLVLILFLITASLPTLTVSYSHGVPQLKSLCNFITEHGPPEKNISNCGDFKLVMMNATHEIPCYTPNELTTVHMVVTNDDPPCNIKGFFLGVQKKGFNMNKRTLESTRHVCETNNRCKDYVTFSHSALLNTKKIEFKFNFTSKERVELRSTVVFSYSDVINNRSYYFDACPTPTPSSTPSPSPTPSSPSSSVAAPSVTPTPSCPSYTATQIDNFKCPKAVEKYKLTMDHEDNGIKYECTTTGTLRHFVFQSNCTRQEVCSTEDDQVCRWRTFSIRNCEMSLDQRKREFLCTAKDNRKNTLTTKIRIGIEKDSLYTCDVTLLDS